MRDIALVHCNIHGLKANLLDSCSDYIYQGHGILLAVPVCCNCVFHMNESVEEILSTNVCTKDR